MARDLSAARVGLEVPRWKNLMDRGSEAGPSAGTGDLEDPGGLSGLLEAWREWGDVATAPEPVPVRVIVSDFERASPR